MLWEGVPSVEGKYSVVYSVSAIVMTKAISHTHGGQDSFFPEFTTVRFLFPIYDQVWRAVAHLFEFGRFFSRLILIFKFVQGPKVIDQNLVLVFGTQSGKICKVCLNL